jgi:hypothetical protein
MADRSTPHWTEISPNALPFQGPLSVHRAFVVHFATAGGTRRRFRGRVEHLSSGRTAHFSSLAQLLGFVAVVLDSTSQPADARSLDRRRGRTRAVGRPR